MRTIPIVYIDLFSFKGARACAMLKYMLYQLTKHGFIHVNLLTREEFYYDMFVDHTVCTLGSPNSEYGISGACEALVVDMFRSPAVYTYSGSPQDNYCYEAPGAWFITYNLPLDDETGFVGAELVDARVNPYTEPLPWKHLKMLAPVRHALC